MIKVNGQDIYENVFCEMFGEMVFYDNVVNATKTVATSFKLGYVNKRLKPVFVWVNFSSIKIYMKCVDGKYTFNSSKFYFTLMFWKYR